MVRRDVDVALGGVRAVVGKSRERGCVGGGRQGRGGGGSGGRGEGDEECASPSVPPIGT